MKKRGQNSSVQRALSAKDNSPPDRKLNQPAVSILPPSGALQCLLIYIGGYISRSTTKLRMRVTVSRLEK